MLSGPPFSFAFSMSRCDAVFRSGDATMIFSMSGSVTGPQRPSEQSRYVSPAFGCSKCVSTLTVSFIPSARTMTFLCGKFAISSGVRCFILM